MTKVRMHPPKEEAEADALKALLAEADCEVDEGHPQPDEIEIIDGPLPKGESGSENTDENDTSEDDVRSVCPPPLIVRLPDDDTPDPAFDNALLIAVQLGSKIIGVWPKEGGGTCPKAFDDYGGDTVPWNADLLREAVIGIPQHRSESGVPAQNPETERHICR